MKHQQKEIPPLEDLEKEIKREKYKKRYSAAIRNTVYSLIVVAAISALVSTLWLPVLQTDGNSMTPTLQDNSIVISVKGVSFEKGDLISFYYNNKILVKRVIAGPSDWVEITEDGTVSVNGKILEEPYISEKALGDCDIEFPYQVPAERYFVLGDHRETSVDSRNSQIGCIAQEQIVGRIVFCVWPFDCFGPID